MNKDRFFGVEIEFIKARRLQPESEIIEAIREGNLIQDEGKTMLVPLMSRGLILGGIKLRKHAGDGVWTKAQLALTETLSGQLGIALESARLFDQSQRRAAREHVIGNASAKMRETLDIEGVLEAAAQEFRNALGVTKAEVWVSVDEEQEMDISEKIMPTNSSNDRE